MAAEPNVVKMMAQASSDHIVTGDLNDYDRHGLRTMLAQMETMGARIRQVLGEDAHAPSTQALALQGSTPVSQIAGEEETAGKLETLAPMTEPTPPLTNDQAEGPMDVE